jgi:hypothetical protein
MNPYLKYGVPATLGIGTSAMAAQEEEDIGSVGLAGATGALGGAAGLLAARQLGPKLAGKLGPFLQKQMETERGQKIADDLTYYGRNRQGTTKRVPRDKAGVPKSVSRTEVVPKKAFLGEQAEKLGRIMTDADDFTDAPNYRPEMSQPLASNQSFARLLGMGTAVATVPAAGLAAGLGGVAAGEIPGAFGIPGFVDPEAYGSSNSPGARYKQSTVNYM